MTNNQQSTPIYTPTCNCGYTKKHPMVQPKGEYTAWGNFLIMFGISYKPIKVKYECLKCKKVVEETTDERILNEFY